MKNAGKIGVLVVLILTAGIFIHFLSKEPIIAKNNSGTDNATQGNQEPKKDECKTGEYAKITYIIDGDTVVADTGEHIRLLEINADEKGYSCYESAKNRLAQLVLNKEVRLARDISEFDKYDRCLRTIFVDNKNINLQLVKEGEAVAAFYEPDVEYKSEMLAAQDYAMKNNIGCEWKK